MNPVRWESQLAVFTTTQVDMYGPPDYFGYDKFIVVNDNESPMVMDYNMGINKLALASNLWLEIGMTHEKLRPVHRYSRVERFSRTLAQLLKLKGNVPHTVVALMSGCEDWESIRTVLKKTGNNKYYNCIPVIMERLKLPEPITLNVTNTLFLKMVNDFEKFQAEFEELETRPKYFPSLRYIAFKVLP